MSLLDDAVRNNLALVDAVCAAQGLRTELLDGWWRVDGPPPPFHPVAQTLRRGVEPAPLAEAARPYAGAGVKDAFGDLALAPHGFVPLFDATWLEYRPGDPAPDPGWARVATEEDRTPWLQAVDVPLPPAVLDATGITAVGIRGDGGPMAAGALLVDSGPVVGIWDFFGEEQPGPLWTSLVRSAATMGKPVVGYERVEEVPLHLALGAVELGPLRVWVQPPPA